MAQNAPILVKKLCVQFRPPILGVIYLDLESNCKRLHQIDLSQYVFSAPDEAAQLLADEHANYLRETLVSQEQLIRLLKKVRNYDGNLKLMTRQDSIFCDSSSNQNFELEFKQDQVPSHANQLHLHRNSHHSTSITMTTKRIPITSPKTNSNIHSRALAMKIMEITIMMMRAWICNTSARPN